MKTLTAILILAASLSAVAQTPALTPKAPAKAEVPKPPTISDGQKAKFFKTQAEMIQAQVQLQHYNEIAQQKVTAFQGMVKEIQDACGKDANLQMDQNGDPACVATPKSTPAAAPKK